MFSVSVWATLGWSIYYETRLMVDNGLATHRVVLNVSQTRPNSAQVNMQGLLAYVPATYSIRVHSASCHFSVGVSEQELGSLEATMDQAILWSTDKGSLAGTVSGNLLRPLDLWMMKDGWSSTTCYAHGSISLFHVLNIPFVVLLGGTSDPAHAEGRLSVTVGGFEALDDSFATRVPTQIMAFANLSSPSNFLENLPRFSDLLMGTTYRTQGVPLHVSMLHSSSVVHMATAKLYACVW